jgi:hypothetical protein
MEEVDVMKMVWMFLTYTEVHYEAKDLRTFSTIFLGKMNPNMCQGTVHRIEVRLRDYFLSPHAL